MHGYSGGVYNVAVTMFNVDGGDVGLFQYAQEDGWNEVFNKQKEGDPAKKFPAARPFAIEQGSFNSSVQGKKEKVNTKFAMREPVEETEALIAMHKSFSEIPIIMNWKLKEGPRQRCHPGESSQHLRRVAF